MEYTIMVAGARAGKTAFLRTLLDTADIAPSATADQLNGVVSFAAGAAGPTVEIRTCSVDVSAGEGSAIRLHVVDTPGVSEGGGGGGGASGRAEQVLSELLRFVGDRFAETLAAGGRSAHDRHVHLCIYLLDPDAIVAPSTALTRAALPPSEVAAIQRLSSRVNVLPVVARADTLTSDRLAAVRLAVRRDLADAGIGFGIFDQDDAQPQDAIAPSFLRLPYALFAPDCYGHTDGVGRQVLSRHELVQTYAPTGGRAHGRLVLGKYTRTYRWGHADVLDHSHCDFLLLRHAIFHHRETLQKYTGDYLYEKFVKEHPPPITLTTRPILTIDAAPLYPPTAAPLPVSVPTQQQQPPAPAPSRAKKITIACNFCRSRKLKCDGARPACHQCQKRTHACDYQAPARGGGAARRKRPSSRSGGEAENGEDTDPDADGEADAGSASPVARSAHTPDHEDVHLSNGNGNGPQYYDHPPPATMLAALAASAGVMKSEPVLPSSLEPHRLVPSLPPPHALSLPAPGLPTQHHALALQHVLHDPATVLPPIRDLSQPGPADAGPSSSAGSSPQAGRKRAATTGQGKPRTNAGYGPKVVACNHCRARKTKCDGQHPTCASCARRNLTCNYVNDPSQPSRRRTTHTAGQTQTISPPQQPQPQSHSQPPFHAQMDGSPLSHSQGPTPPGLIANGNYSNANGHTKRELDLDSGNGPEGSPGRGDAKRMRLVNGIT